MRLPRLTIRRAMIAVAVAAVLFGFGSRALLSRRQSFLSDAAYHARREAEERRNLAHFESSRSAGGPRANVRSRDRKLERASRLRLAYHADRKQSYLRAASRPWESVPPDPGEPGDLLLWDSLLINHQTKDLLLNYNTR